MKRSRTVLCVTILTAGVALWIGAVPAFGGDSPLWGELQPGPFGVGFKTIELFDYSRSFLPELDYFGAPLTTEPGRPIQMCYWYPATLDSGSTAMVYSEYAFPYPSDSRLFPLLSNLQNRELGTIFAFTRGNQAQVSQIMNYQLLAVRDAAPASGKFPLIVYHGSERGAYCQNVVLCEYLASHGFVVATTHVVGMSGVESSESPTDIETVVRDKELAVASLRELPFVNTRMLGLIGYNYGITTAFIHQMRNYSVDAIATLHGQSTVGANEWAALYRSNSYSPQRMSAPWLVLRSRSLVLDGGSDLPFRYCQQYSVCLPSVRTAEFSVYGAMGILSGADTTRTIEEASLAQGVLGLYLWRFFDDKLRDNQASRDWLAPQPGSVGQVGEGTVFSRYDAEAHPPTADQFQNIIQTYGVARAKEVSDKFGFPTPENPMLPDATYTAMGYRFLQTGDIPSALQVFAWGVAAYPGSANAWDSYGEATATSGDPVTALAHYRKALEILPSDSLIDPNMKTQLQTSIPANIQRLEQEIAAQNTSGGGSK